MTTYTPFDVFGSPLDGINLIEASAGTGKTWNICGLYLRLLLERQLDTHQILVVTFTNAATAELRERIRNRIVEMRDYLDDRHTSTPDPFVSKLCEKLEQQADFSRKQTTERLEHVLRTFDEASIFTIHGFCQHALADSAFASGQAFVQELMPDDSELRMEVVHDFWRKHIASDNLGAELAASLLQQKDTPERFAALLKRRLAKPLAIYQWPMAAAPAIDRQALTAAYAAAKSEWETKRADIVDLLEASLGTLNKISYKEKSIRDAATDYDNLFSANDPLSGSGEKSKLRLLCSSVLTARTNGKNTPPQHVFFDLAETLLAERTSIEQSLAIARLNLLKTLLDELPDLIRQRKHERRLLSFDDILHNLHTALNDGQYPWLAESLRQRYPAALVDEFQDTDPLQFSVFNTIYGEHNNPLFLVGDPKQAIYRFRNADLNTYLQAKKKADAIYTISDNQRSTDELIGALNQLFATNPQAFMLPGLGYQAVGIGSKRPAPFDDRSGEPSHLHLWRLPNEAESHITRSEAMRQASDATAGEIARLLNQAQSGNITIDGQRLQAGDIAVLVRSHRQGNAIRQALTALNVGSVELSQASVFASNDAEEIERILTAIWAPARTALLRAALATELIACDANEIEAISTNESVLMQHIQRFMDYRDIWLQRGIGFVFRQMLTNEKISARMLRRPDGERRMTNLLHLGELLHQAAQLHPSPDALLRWLQTQRQEASVDEAAQLRLETDRNLVQILTIHKAKGLEFPIVFCPFLWDGYRQTGGRLEGREYHDGGNTFIDFRPETQDDKAIGARIREENDAEDLRLIYVALTRAVHRCYLVTGCYLSHNSTNQSKTSLLNWLVAGSDLSPEEWATGNRKHLEANDIEHAWNVLAENGAGNVYLAQLPQLKSSPLTSDMPLPDALVCRQPPTHINSGWRISSFSGLKRGATHENAASDRDLLLSSTSSKGDGEAMRPAEDDILNFPKGANAGDCIHKAFEICDFTAPDGWADAIENSLSEHPQQTDGHDRLLPSMMMNMMRDVTATTLINDLALCDVGPGKRLTELGFYLPASNLSASRLNRTLKANGYEVPQLHFSDLECHMKGFIDLVFEHDGRYYILDWKSNYLGDSAIDYDASGIADAMADNGYHLQYLLYTVALDRYLQRRIHNYHYETHFGGVLYLFVRGVRPEWKNADGSASGVYWHLPAKDVIEQLTTLFANLPAKAA